ncbi:helix-turn-helix domain-containing protein [Nesterenkonia sp. K-15-9-6]|uniref:helix-turn-helix domain-containing protein n=1 Tax=Nesterenkonia sp. K-15-9-6 TaxID=3093918 RepID=UPI0040449C4A
MSWKALSWAEDICEEMNLPANQRWILHLLANMADEQWSCFPSIKYLERKSGLGDRTVRTCVRKLREQGLIEVEDRRNQHGGRMGYRYYLQPTMSAETSPEASEEGHVNPGMAVPANSAGRSGEPVENLPANIAGRPSIPGMAVPANIAGRGSYRQITTSLPANIAGPAREVNARASLTSTENHHSSSSPQEGEFSASTADEVVEPQPVAEEEPAGGAAGEEEQEIPGHGAQRPVGSSAFGDDHHQPASTSPEPAGPGLGYADADSDVPAEVAGHPATSGLAGPGGGQGPATHRGVELGRLGQDVAMVTGRVLEPATLAALVDVILGRASSRVANPAAFVAASVRNNPARTQEDVAGCLAGHTGQGMTGHVAAGVATGVAGHLAAGGHGAAGLGAGLMAGQVSGQVSGHVSGHVSAGVAGAVVAERPGCPVDDHASYGHRQGRCPVCRSEAAAGGWVVEYDASFPAELVREKFERLGEEHQAAAVKQKVRIVG